MKRMHEEAPEHARIFESGAPERAPFSHAPGVPCPPGIGLSVGAADAAEPGQSQEYLH